MDWKMEWNGLEDGIVVTILLVAPIMLDSDPCFSWHYKKRHSD